MYKMIIVDDEYLVRTGICETIDWSSYGIEVVATAVNGADGLKKIEQLHPDIIISDVRMPVMDGIQLATRLYEQDYDGITIILSGYNDFEYAKATLEVGVFKYLLKPIDNDELVGIVQKAVEKLKSKRKLQNYISDFSVGIPVIKARIADGLFHGSNIDEDAVREKLALYDMPIINRGVVVYCKADLVDGDEEATRQALELVEQKVLDILSNQQVIWSGTEKRLAFATDFCDIDVLEKRLVAMLREYEKNSKVLMSIGISDVFNGLGGISSAFGAAKFIALNRLYVAINSVSVATDAASEKIYKKNIVEALKYISEHYSENELKIKTVADALYVSESYLMHLFKQELGKTFNTCLTEYRIMTAKRLLLEQKYKVYEIAEMVGYVDMKYFGQVFRKTEGCTPSEYIKKQENK